MIGFAMCGSYCTHAASLRELERLKDRGADILPIVSENVYSTDTRFGSARALRERLGAICGRECIHTVVDAEPLGPKMPLEALIICPCTGNTLAKMANGITDTAVTMAAKAHLRSDRPLIIAL
ncbi:MAG: dipicolinate synthase subunit B, partial [Clostridia bacterium]|nr:dipicolinate synthase subunit B [Clostridia bacterium]